MATMIVDAPSSVTQQHTYSKVSTFNFKLIFAITSGLEITANPPWLTKLISSQSSSGGIGRAASVTYSPRLVRDKASGPSPTLKVNLAFRKRYLAKYFDLLVKICFAERQF